MDLRNRLTIIQLLATYLLWLGSAFVFPAPDDSADTNSDDTISVLIVDGRNNHAWESTTHALKQTLNQTGRFDVTISSAPKSFKYKKPYPKNPGGGATETEQQHYQNEIAAWRVEEKAYEKSIANQWQAWRPKFADFDVVINNYNGPNWPAEVQQSFIDFVQAGGGLVNIHAANNAFVNWTEFNQMIGLGWRKTNQGISLTVDDETGKTVETPNGEGINSGHGSKHPFVLKTRHSDHPIMRGIPDRWLHGNDELYHAMRGPAENVDILATAFSDPKQRGTGKHEPIVWTTKFGDGRVVTNTMGHIWVGPNLNAEYPVHCVGFQTILIRSVEWAATGATMLDVPAEFPSTNDLSIVHPEKMEWTFVGKLLPAAPGAIADPKKRGEYKKQLNPYCLLTPEETLATIEVQPGFKMELVVSEPHVTDPVLCVWGGNGRLYVAEMRSYMQDEFGTRTKTLKNGRISRHEDTTGDGKLDMHTVFVDNLNLPRMILPLDDRIAVTETDSTDVWSYRDTDDDGVADEKILLYQGDREIDTSRSVEHQDSGLFWSIDNWIYLSRGRKRYRFTDNKWIAENIEFDWNQWGMDQDDMGRLFFNDNSHPAKSFQQHPIYWNLIKSRAKGRWLPPRLGDDYQPEFMVMHSICKIGDRGEPHAYQSFTSATGGSVYRGDTLPSDVNGNYFVADPTGHLIRRADLKRTDGRITLENVYENQKGEFVRSTDINFRPVNTHSGPDGALYIVDMHRGMIQDAPWVNDGMKAFLRRSGLNFNIHHGRIYRVVHESKSPMPPPKMLDMDAAELVNLLKHENGWVRDTAQKLIVLRCANLKETNAVETELLAVANESVHPLGQIHAMWTLDGLGKTNREILWANYNSLDWRVRATAIRISEQLINDSDGETIERLAKLTLDSNPNVARQLILSLGGNESEKTTAMIDETIENHLANEVVFLSAMTSLYDRKTPLIKRLMTGQPFRLIPDVTERANAQRRWKNGIASWEKPTGPARPLDDEAVKLIDHGYQIYAQLCTNCHGSDGRGATQLGQPIKAPPLAGSSRVLGEKEVLTRILLHGLTGPVDSKEYREVMAPMDKESDEWIAAIASYIRQEWGNLESVVRPSDVATIRAASKSKYRPWTLMQLRPFALPPIKDRNQWAISAKSGVTERSIDGESTACEMPNRPGSWIAVDLGGEHTISGVTLNSKNNDRYPRAFAVTVSTDGTQWSDPVATGIGEAALTKISFEPVLTRHVRIEQTGNSDHHRWSIADLQIFGVLGAVVLNVVESEAPLPPADELLAMAGNAESGKMVFDLRCNTCHRIAGKGVSFGPDLSDVGKRLKKADILQSILDPNATIDPKHIGEMILTVDGKLLTGFVTDETDQQLTIQLPNAVVETIEQDAILERKKQKTSAMPSGLERVMTTQQLVDLTQYLQEQKAGD